MQSRIPTLILLLVMFRLTASACGMCLFTEPDGTVLVGNNEDAWSHEGRIWWTPALEGMPYGVAFVGHKRGVAQGGMNEAGLVYDAFTQYYRPAALNGRTVADKDFVQRLLHRCANVHEVKALLEDKFINYLQVGSLWFVDANGDHLVVEADTMILASGTAEVLSNFRVSDGMAEEDIPVSRYHRGRAAIAEGKSAKGIMAAMSECRGTLGDGTLYTNIWDTRNAKLDLYFYHDFEHGVTFDLREELAKGAHVTEMASLFPPNEHYQAYLSYITPHSHTWMWWLMVLSAALLWLCSMTYLIYLSYLLLRRKQVRASSESIRRMVVLLLVNAFTLFCMAVLMLREEPYYRGMSSLQPVLPWSGLVYAPLLTSLMIAAILFRFLSHRQSNAVAWLNKVFWINLLLFVLQLALWLYWGLLWV